jgi:hypothetical protein
MRVVEFVVAMLLAVLAGQVVGVGSSCTVVLLDTAICNSACDAPRMDVLQLQLTGTLVS